MASKLLNILFGNTQGQNSSKVHASFNGGNSKSNDIDNVEAEEKDSVDMSLNSIGDINETEHNVGVDMEAHGLPYTVPPLSTLLNPDSLTPFGQQVLNGAVDFPSLEVSHHTKLLLQHQKAWQNQHLPCFHTLTFKDMITGFRKWPEWTSTSPSGQHLGIYKSLSKDTNRKQRHQKPTPQEPTEHPKSKPPIHNEKNVLQLIHQLIYMAVQHCHTFDRWQMIWNLFLEKEIGVPKITKLRALHIVEADYNLLLK